MSQSRVRLKRTKCALEVATASYVLVLVLTCVFSRIEHAMVLNLGALGLALVACGSGAARLCNALRQTGATNTKIAETVFSVSRSMGTCFCEYSHIAYSKRRFPRKEEHIPGTGTC